jgi:hypothetical protein
MKKTDEELEKALNEIYGNNEVAKDMVFGLKKLLDEARQGNAKKEEVFKKLELLEEQGQNNVETFIEILKTLNLLNNKEYQTDLKKIFPEVFKGNVVSVRETKEVQKVELVDRKVEVKEPSWLKQLNPFNDIVKPVWEGIAEAIKKIFKVQIVNTGDPSQPVAVRLSDGKKFYNAIITGIQGLQGFGNVGGGGGAISFSNSAGIQKEALIDGSRHPQVDIVEDLQYSTPYKHISTADDNDNVVKASAGRIYGWSLTNVSANECYVKFYNQATAPANTDTPVLTVLVPGNMNGAGNNLALPRGVSFSAGISFRIVTGVADNDNTGVSANEVVVNLMYL